MSVLFSIVVLSFNSSRTLDLCLRSAVESLSQLSSSPSEIIVVENGSTDNSRQILSEWVRREPNMIRAIYMNENTGTTVSRNAALKQCTGEYVVILDSDAYLNAESLIGMSSYLDENQDVGLVCPKLFYGDGRFQISVDQFPTLLHKAKRFLFLNTMQDSLDHNSLKTQPVDYAISACWMIARRALDKVPYFDERIFYSPEDVDYCMQIWLSGFKIIYLPSLSVIHNAQELSRGFRLSSFHIRHLKGLFYLFFKYRYFFTPPNKRG